ncbi:hypothetical protein LTR09_006472 [Extremus antarcticus]|uniref:F-box domain-containing protein n=1 Tax=Extremus antarcticus TaxID=702011 RepID=A0AAJ0DE80_9PEZI|nr:hypothetical protein LTR09_006472 [Extremus antarcticus]
MANNNTPRCHLLSLPAELRLRIYSAVLAPTNNLFLTRDRHKSYKVDPIISRSLLATCHQIHNEAASILYKENTVSIVVNINENAFPLIPKARLPQRFLEKLQHMCLFLDGCSPSWGAPTAENDWTALTALTALKTMRLTLLAAALPSRPIWEHTAYWEAAKTFGQNVLREVVERVPASTRIAYGTEEGTVERDIATRLVDQHNLAPISAYEAGEVDGESLELAASTMEVEAGCDQINS